MSPGPRTATVLSGSVLCLLLVTACSGEDRPDPSDDALTTPQQTESSASLEAGLPDYTASVRPVSGAVRSRMVASHHVGCPVSLSDLRYVEVRFHLPALTARDAGAASADIGCTNPQQKTPRTFVPIVHPYSEEYFLRQNPWGPPPDDDL